MEGSGKSTHLKRAAAFLRRNGHRVLVLREPGGTRVGEAIREILLDKNHRDMTCETELLLYLAARAQIVREKILPALRKGRVVICDRFEDSTMAYQGYGRGISIKKIRRIILNVGTVRPARHLAGGEPPLHLQPDLTFLLDLDPAEGMKRGGRHDRVERESLAFHRKVRRGFLALARKNKRRFIVLDAHRPIETVAQKIRKELDRVLG